jgi:hypothetical protein
MLEWPVRAGTHPAFQYENQRGVESMRAFDGC